MKFKIYTIFVGLFLSFFAFSQTPIPGGDVSGTWTAFSSPYVIEGDIWIEHDHTLIIEPGVELLFSHSLMELYEFNVYGKLIAEGTETDSIFFSGIVSWVGINFIQLDTNSMDSSRVKYCHLRSASGAISCDTSSKVNISNTLFIYNHGSQGSGISCNYSSPRIDQVTIKNSNVILSGGGLYINDNSHPTISNAIITNNTAGEDGGGVYINDNCNPVFENVDVSWNTSGEDGGGFYCYHNNNPVMTNVVIRHNVATAKGGGLIGWWDFDPVCTDVIIRNNYADEGGGIYFQTGDLNISNTLLYENTAEYGGGIFCNSSNIQIDHITLYNNTGFSDGGGLYIENIAEVVLNNSIIWNNTPQSFLADCDPGDCSLTATYSDIEGGTGETWFGTGCLDIDPEFVDPVLWDYSLSWIGFPYLQRSSCINWGDPSSPLDPDGSRTDMGAIIYTISEGTYINGGDYCGSWNLSDSPFLVEGEVNVPVGCELTIQHGVEVIYWRREAMNIYGRLIAEGFSWDKIKFRDDGLTRWKGIKFYNTNTNGQDSSLIEHAEIKNVFNSDHHISGGGLYLQNSSDIAIKNSEISNCFLVGDASAQGAGILCDESSPVIHDLVIRDCETEAPAVSGTAIYCHTNSNPQITRALIYNNDSEASDYAWGGGIACVNSDPILTNITITQNNMLGSNQYGGAIYAYGCDPVINNCIFYNNDNAEVYLESGASPLITYSNIDDGTGQPWFGTGCIDADPLFLDPGSNDFHLSWDNFPVPDATQSPCIDTGDPSSPLDPDDTQADMGMYPFYQAYWLCGNTKGKLTPSGSPYIVTCDVTVLSTDSLIIEPGVEVIFMGNYKLEVYGQLFAEGTETDSIHFRPWDFSTGWHGIRFMNTETNSWPPSVLKYCDISGGLAFDDYSGGIDEWGGAILCYNSSDVEISNSTIHNNRAFGSGLGGGIYCYGSDIIIDSVNIFDNYAGYAGGGIYLDDSDPEITRTIIAGNSASTSGAGIHVEENSSPQITNVTITENSGALFGGGIYIFNTTPTIKNTIVWNNENGAIGVAGTNYFTVSYSCIEGGWPGTGNVAGDPLFVDPGNYDFSLNWDNYPEPDETKSSAIDMGEPAPPSDPDGTRNDIGAIYYEQTYTAIPGGNISGTLYCANSPYYVFGDLTVLTGEELIIEPCVYVGFQGDYKLTVNGRLLAEGTESERITFYPADTITGWGGIRFYNQNTNGQDSSKMNHCRIMYGNADELYSYDGYGGGVFLFNSSDVLIDNCLFLENRAVTSGGGLFMTANSSPVVRNSSFIGNTALDGGAIYCYDNINTTFLNCYFTNNVAQNGGAIMTYSCTPGFSGCTMTNNHALKFGGAIYHSANGPLLFDEIIRCNIYDNYADYAGLDFYTDDGYYTPPVLDVFLDTASVVMMNEHFAYPFHLFNITSNYSRFTQEDFDLFVSATGSDLNSGTSAADPLKTIKMALIKIIADKQNPKTIHLAEGTYSPSLSSETLPINHRSHITLSGENTINTFLEGDTLHRILVSYADKNDSVKNLTFQYGHKDGDGGAVVLENNSTPTFFNVAFKNNYCSGNGGAVWSHDDCNPVFSNVNFVMDTSLNSGGAMFCQSIDTLIMDNVSFIYNASRYSGGALQVDASDECRLYKCTFFANSLSNGSGGGACIRNTTMIVDSVTFHANQAIGDAGGLWAYGADIFIHNSRFIANSASGSGGGIGFYLGVNLSIKNTLFLGNLSNSGGGIWGYANSTTNIKNSLFIGNNTLFDPYSTGNGGAMNLQDVTTHLSNITLHGNEAAGDGGGICFWSPNTSQVHSVQNSILWANEPDQIYLDYNANADVDYCDIEDGWTPGTGNINIDPEINEGGDWSLQPGSPCINAANYDTTGLDLPLFDMAGNPRISLDTLDMGAFEFFQGIELELKAFLEGPYNGTTMNTNLAGHPDPEYSGEGFPFQQPYNTTPWNYTGAEEVTTLPFENIVDWMLIEVRDTTDVTLATPESVISRQAVFLLDDGSLVDINGNNIKFGNPIDHECFITVYHRNHLGIISAYPLTESEGIYSYDFTTSAGQAFMSGQSDLGGGNYGMYAGDADGSGEIHQDDIDLRWSGEVGGNGYFGGDMDMNGQVDNQDKNDVWLPNNTLTDQVPD